MSFNPPRVRVQRAYQRHEVGPEMPKVACATGKHGPHCFFFQLVYIVDGSMPYIYVIFD